MSFYEKYQRAWDEQGNSLIVILRDFRSDRRSAPKVDDEFGSKLCITHLQLIKGTVLAVHEKIK